MTKRILAISGGGIFGLLPALILQEIERRTGKPAGEIFDLIAGTSTGGIIACGLAAGVPASDLVSLYKDDGASIFDASIGRDVVTVDGITGPKYSADVLESLLQKNFGAKMLRGITGAPALLVPTTRCNRSPHALWFRSWDGLDFPLWQVARATSAAPYYFPVAVITASDGSEHVCADGGLFANDPEDYATACAKSLWPSDGLAVLSLGTGSSPLVVDVKPDWGGADWMPDLIELTMQSQEDVTAERVALSGAVRTVLNPPIGGAMDDASPANIAAIEAAAEAVISGLDFAAFLVGLAGT